MVSQLAGIVQSQVATEAGTSDASVFILRNAWLIFMLPHSIVTVSIATAVMWPPLDSPVISTDCAGRPVTRRNRSISACESRTPWPTS